MTAARPPMQDTHDRFALAMDKALRAIRKAKVLRVFPDERPPAELAEYKRGTL